MDPLTNADFDDFQRCSVDMLSEALGVAPIRKVFNVYDISAVDYHPPMYLMLGKALPVLRFKNRGALFVVTKKGTHRSMFELTAHVMNFGLRFYDDFDAAICAAEDAVAREDLQLSSM